MTNVKEMEIEHEPVLCTNWLVGLHTLRAEESFYHRAENKWENMTMKRAQRTTNKNRTLGLTMNVQRMFL